MHDALRAFVTAILGLTESGADPASLELRLACAKWIGRNAALEEAPTRSDQEMLYRERQIRRVA